MKLKETLYKKISSRIDPHTALLPYVPLIEIADDCRVLIENHKGVVEYGNERIGVKVRFGVVCICGTQLEMAQITKEQLVITGEIDSISICREGGR